MFIACLERIKCLWLAMFICYIFGSTGNDAAIWVVDNGIEAYHIGEWSRYAPNCGQFYTWCTILILCPNSFRVGISQLISTYIHFSMIACPLFEIYLPL